MKQSTQPTITINDLFSLFEARNKVIDLSLSFIGGDRRALSDEMTTPRQLSPALQAVVDASDALDDQIARLNLPPDQSDRLREELMRLANSDAASLREGV